MAVEARRHVTRLRTAAARRRSAPIACGATSPLAPLTTFRVGGPADWLLETRSSDEIVTALRLARDAPACRSRILGGGSNVLVADARRPRAGDSAARRRGARRSTTAHVRADAAVTINGLVRWTIIARLRRPRSVGRARRARSAARSSATRTSAAASSAISSPRCGSRRATARSTDVAAVGDGVRLRSQPPAGHRRGAAVGDVSRVAGRSGGAARDGARSRWRFASGRSRSTRRAPAASFRIRSRAATACRTASRGRPARSSIAPG